MATGQRGILGKMGLGRLVAGAVQPAVAPSLVHLGAVEERLSQLVVHAIVELAQPHGQLLLGVHIDRVDIKAVGKFSL